MGLIYDIKSTLTQTALDAFCEKYHVPGAVHPELPGPNQSIRNSPADMDLFAFIRHADPTEVRIGKKQIKDGQTPLLDSTRGRVVSLAVGDDRVGPSIPVVHGDHNDEVDNVGTHGLNKEGSDTELRYQNEEGGHVVQDEGVNIMADDEIQAIVVDKPKGTRRKRKAASGASGSILPPKKLKEDHGTFSDTGSNSSHHSSANAVDVEVSSFDRYYVLPIPVMTMVLSTSATAGASTILVFGTGTRPVHRSIFWPSLLLVQSGQMLSIYVPKWNVINDYALHEPKACRSVVDHLAPLTCLGAEVRMRCEHNLMERKRFKDKCARHCDFLKKKDIEITDLKAQLSLKEAEATEAIRLHGQEEKGVLDGKVEALESAAVSKETELASLTTQTAKLTQDLSSMQLSFDELSIKAASLESQKDNLTDQVSLLETTCSGLCDQVFGYELFKEQFETVQDEQVKVLSDRVAELDPELMSMDIHLDEEFYPRFLTIIAGRYWILSRGITLATELVAGIGHGKAGRGLTDDAAYDPSAEAKYVFVFLTFRNLDFEFLSLLESQKDACIADIIDSLRLEGLVVETQRSTVHAHVQKVKEGALCHRLSIFDAMGPLVDPLSFENLVGEASASGVLVTVAVTTGLSTTFSHTSFVPPISVANYGMPDAEPQPEASHSLKIIFEQETLETSSENPATMLSAIHTVPSHLSPSFSSSSAWLASLFRYTSFRPYVSENGVSSLLDLIMASVCSFHQTIGLRMFDEGKALADA
uniref:Transposase (Putative), gypsy type n=1 Tax=Tanacetum cinerariifolium TaxID=118510 RepID=A0A6L2JEZ0_TANCI|nr:hypothetical protein [Tanacetum cinerariifolium]